MKHLFTTVLFYLLFASIVWSQNTVSKNLQITFEPNSASRFAVFNNNDKLTLAPDVAMRLLRSTKDVVGGDHDRYEQFYKGIKVVGPMAIVHSKNDQARSITGYIENRLENLTVKPEINEKAAIDISRFMMADVLEKEDDMKLSGKISPKTEGINLCIVNEYYPETHGKMVLAYEVIQSINVWNIPIKRTQYIDAISGKPINSINNIITHKSKGKGQSNFYGSVSFDHDSIGPNEFYMRDLSRGEGVFVQNLKTEKVYENTAADWKFEDSNDKAAVDVIFGAQKFYDLLKDRFNFNSIDNKGFPLIGKVNKFLYSNAFWDGESTTYGGGNCHTYRSFTTIDVVGHEFAHGLTEFNSNLVYTGEPASINESMSDIFGKALEFYTLPNQFTWTLGYRIPVLGSDAIRSMSNPNLLEQPNYYKGKYWTESIFRSAHQNNGVMNYWFYIIVNGKKGIDERGKSYDVKAIGMDKAIEIVFLLNTSYLHPTSDYHDVYENSKIVAEYLYGANSDEYNTVVNAWSAVGLPFVPIVYKDLALSVAINGNTDLNPFECYEPIKNMDFSINNISTVSIPPNTIMTLNVNGEYTIDNVSYNLPLLDTVLLITDSLRLGQSLHVEAKNISLPEAISNIFFTYNVQAIFENTKYNQTFYQSLQYLKQADRAEDYFNAQYMYNQIENVCDKKSNVSRTFAYINFKLCYPDSFLFETVFENGTSSKSIFETKSVTPSRYFSDVRLDVENPDLSMFEDKSEVFIHMYVWINNERYLLISDTLAKYFLQPLTKDEKITFEGLTDFKEESRLQIYPAIFSPTSVTEGNLSFTNTWTRTALEDCAKLEDFYQYILSDAISGLDISEVLACPNMENMTNPHLGIDVLLSTLPSVSGTDHRHGLMVLQDEKLVTTPAISNTSKLFKTFEIPLNKELKTPLALKLFLDGSEGRLDNIHIFDKSSVSTKDGQNAPFSITNPNINEIKIFWEENIVEAKTYLIMDINGKPVAQGQLLDVSTTIDCTQWPAGMYLYKIQSHTDSWVGKIMVVR